VTVPALARQLLAEFTGTGLLANLMFALPAVSARCSRS
jgi:hypothetical protein